MARTFTIISVCDACLDEGKSDVPGISVDVVIGDASGALDLCRDHRPLVDQIRQLVIKSGRPIGSDPATANATPPPPQATAPDRPDTPPETPDPKVTCGLCGHQLAQRYRAMHARRVHNKKTGQIPWEGDLPYPCPATGCTYAAASAAGRAQHIRREHPKHDPTGAA